MTIYWETLTPETRELFNLVARLPFMSEFYLGGGTGLALQLGHRFSVDLNFFSDSADAVGIVTGHLKMYQLWAVENVPP